MASAWRVYVLSDARDGFPVYVGCTSDVGVRLRQHVIDLAVANRQMKIWFSLVDRRFVHADTLYVVDDRRTALALERSTIMRFAEEGIDLFNRGHNRQLGRRFTEAHLQLRSAFGRSYAAFQRSGFVLIEANARRLWNGDPPEMRVALALRDRLGIPLERWLRFLEPRMREAQTDVRTAGGSDQQSA